MKYLRILVVAAMYAVWSAAPVPACESIVVLQNFRLFHNASAVYEAVATSADFEFTVTRTWWGEPRETITLPWAADQAAIPCSDQLAVKPGGRCLLVIYCGDDEDQAGERVECRSLAEQIWNDSERLLALGNNIWLEAWQVDARLHAWLAGDLATAEFSDWVTRMERTAMVPEDDWIIVQEEDGEDEVSRVGTALLALDGMLISCEEDEEPDRALVAAELAPLLHRLLYAESSIDIDTYNRISEPKSLFLNCPPLPTKDGT